MIYSKIKGPWLYISGNRAHDLSDNQPLGIGPSQYRKQQLLRRNMVGVKSHKTRCINYDKCIVKSWVTESNKNTVWTGGSPLCPFIERNSKIYRERPTAKFTAHLERKVLYLWRMTVRWARAECAECNKNNKENTNIFLFLPRVRGTYARHLGEKKSFLYTHTHSRRSEVFQKKNSEN